MSHDRYESPLVTRNASEEMLRLFSPRHRIGLWRRELSSGQIRSLERLGGHALQALGYELSPGAPQADSSPNQGTGYNQLKKVDATATNNVWALGSGGSGNLVERYDGTAWHIVSSPPVGLRDLDVLTANEVWAVGNSGSTTAVAAVATASAASAARSVQVVSLFSIKANCARYRRSWYHVTTT